MSAVPSRFFTIDIAGETYDFRLTNANIKKMEQSYKLKYGEIMGRMEEDVFTGFQAIMWASRLPFDPKFTKSDADNLWDIMIDDGMDIADIQTVIMKILQESGLVPKSVDVDAAIREQLDLNLEGLDQEDLAKE